MFVYSFNDLPYFYYLQELQLHLGVLQQHAALIGGPNATSCPICHKLFLGGEALMEHMKHTHKDPNASGVASKYPILPRVRDFYFFGFRIVFFFKFIYLLTFMIFIIFYWNLLCFLLGFYCIPGDHRFMFFFPFFRLLTQFPITLKFNHPNKKLSRRSPRTKTLHCVFEIIFFL